MPTTGCAAAATAGRRRKKAILAFAGPTPSRNAAVGRKECRIGTNPLIVAIPSTPITMVDMSMSMFSYGMLEVNRLAGRQLPVDGGFDDEGNLTKEPGVIEKNRRILPMGYWKGSGMSIVLDMIATLLSDGASVAEVTQDNSDEYGISQIFIAIEVDKLIDGPTRDAKLQRIMDYVTSAERADENQAILLPGHEFTTLLAENRRNGITVDDSAKIRRYEEISRFLDISAAQSVLLARRH